MRYTKIQGILIHKFDIGENDQFITWYTREHGKLKTKVRGATKLKSKFLGHLEYFNICDLEIYQSHKIPVITQCQSKNTFSGIKSNLESLDVGIKVIKLLDQMTYEQDTSDEHHSNIIFSLVCETLDLIAGSEKKNLIFECFRLQLLALSGLLPDFKTCSHCGKKLQKDIASYLGHKGNIICANCIQGDCTHSPVSFKSIKLTSFLLENHLSIIEKLKLSPEEESDFCAMANKLSQLHFGATLSKNEKIRSHTIQPCS